MTFYSFDLDPMTFIFKLNLDMIKRYRIPKMTFLAIAAQKL